MSVVDMELQRNRLLRRNIQKIHGDLAGQQAGWSNRRVPRTETGIPFLTDPGILTNEEQQDTRHKAVVEVRIFDLLDEEDLEEYQGVLQRIVDGLAHRLSADRYLDTGSSDKYRCLVQWFDIVALPPRNKGSW